MSDGHDHDHDDDAADAHDEHPFDGEPAKELGPGEPMTPGWIPAVGAALFVAAAVFFLVERKDADIDAPAPAATAPQIVATAVQPANQPRVLQAPVAAQPAQPAKPGEPTLNRLSPDQMKELQKRLKEAADKRAAQPGGAP